MEEALAAVAAAIIAAAFSLMGAIIAGKAAKQGAKIGALETGKAMLEQVREQAIIEHGHWLRELRKDAYEAYIAAMNDMISLLNRWEECRDNGTDRPSDEEVISMRNKLGDAGIRVGLSGPESMLEIADRVRAVLKFRESLLMGESGDLSPENEELWSEVTTASAEMCALFVVTASETLGKPTSEATNTRH